MPQPPSLRAQVPKFDKQEEWATIKLLPSEATSKLPKTVAVTKAEFKIGRNGNNDLQVLNGKVSGLHCKLIKQGRGCQIVDCSTNGTFVNGTRTDKKFLAEGDLIHLLIEGDGITQQQQIGFTVSCKETEPKQTADFGLAGVLSQIMRDSQSF